MKQSPHLDGQDSSAHQPRQLPLLDALTVVVKRKKMIAGVTILAAIVSVAFAILTPNVYTGTAQILPPQSQSGASALMGQLSVLSGAVGQSLGVKNPNDTYVAMLNSRTVADALIRRFDLAKVYDSKYATDTRTELALSTSIFSGKDGIISIQVDDESPQRAAELANAYVEELQKLTQILAVTEASQRRLFFEKQLNVARSELKSAEVGFRELQERTGLIQLTGQSEGIIKAAAELKAQIGAKEVELSAVRTFATARNPEYVRIAQELTGLKIQLKKIEAGTNNGNGDISIPTSKVPGAGLEYVRKLRDVKYYESMFELLAKQYELAKIDEAKQSSIIQTLDVAVVPDKKTKPARSIIVVASTAFGFALSVVFALLSDAFTKLLANESHRLRLNELRSSLSWK